MKHTLKIKHYVRYTDDFAIVGEDRDVLQKLLPEIEVFLKEKLALDLHPKKIILQPFHRGVDFLGYVIFPHHRLVRTKTRQRMFKKMRKRSQEYREGIIDKTKLEASLQSYLGAISHADNYEVGERLLNEFWIP